MALCDRVLADDARLFPDGPGGSTSAQRWAALSGIAGALMFAVGNAIWGLDMPEDGTGVAEVVEFYADTADRIVIGGSLSLLSIAVFLVFGAALRQVLKDAGAEDFLATTAFAGLVLAMATGIAAESINLAAALRAQDDELSGDLAQSLFETSQMFGSAATGIGLGVFALATAAVALRTRAVLPRWLAIATAVMGVLLLLPGGARELGGRRRSGPAQRLDRRGALREACFRPRPGLIVVVDDLVDLAVSHLANHRVAALSPRRRCPCRWRAGRTGRLPGRRGSPRSQDPRAPKH